MHAYTPIDPSVGAALIEAAGTASFAPLFLSAAQGVDAVDEIFAYHVTDGGVPQAILASSELGDSTARSNGYARQFHWYDPAVRVRLALAANTGFATLVTAAQIERRDYRAICFDRPRFIDKICFGWRGGDSAIVLSFYRRRGGDDALGHLAGLANLGLAALARSTGLAGTGSLDRIEARITAMFPELTSREREVCARTVAGWTARAIGAALGIGATTVLTYRQRAYRRLGFTSSAEFLPTIIH